LEISSLRLIVTHIGTDTYGPRIAIRETTTTVRCTGVQGELDARVSERIEDLWLRHLRINAPPGTHQRRAPS
jgi:hypothetical protein